MPTTRRHPHQGTVAGTILGTVAAAGLGLVLWIATGQALYLLLGAVGSGVGLVLGAALDVGAGHAQGGCPGANRPDERPDRRL